MGYLVRVKKVGKGLYGTTECEATFVKHGKVVKKIRCVTADVRWIDRAYTKEFLGATIQRAWLKKKTPAKRKTATKRKTAAKRKR